MNATQVLAETPTVAAVKTPALGGGLKQGKPKQISSDFEEQIKSLKQEALMPAQTTPENNSSSITDISMADSSESTGIAGILEGFGLLDYQPDTPQALSGNALPEALAHQGFEQTGEETPLGGEAERAGVAEQFAWMRSNKPLGAQQNTQQQAVQQSAQQQAVQQNMQQETRSEIKEYLGSLESTNNQQAAIGAADTKEKNVPQGSAESLLLKLKTVKHTTVEPTVKPLEAKAESKTQQPAVQQSATAPDVPVKNLAKALAAAEAEFKPQAESAPVPQGMPVQTQSTVSQTATTPDVPEQPATDFVKDNVIRIVDKVSTQAAEGKYEFEVALKPDFLGKVSIKLTMENGSIRMQIRSEDMGAKALLSDQMAGLQSQLKDKGFVVTSIEFTSQGEMTAGGGYEAYRQNGSHGGFGNSKQNGRGFTQDTILIDTGIYDALAGTADNYLGGSTVEYLA